MMSTTQSLEAEAAKILREVDFQASEHNQNALDAAREGEEARRNARLAADLIRRYKPNHNNHAATSSSSSPHENSPPSLPHKSSGMSRRSAHAELLSLKLEMERCQRALAEEKGEHEKTRKALEAAEQTEKSLRADVDNLLHNQETLREDLGRKNDELQRELAETKERLVTADQDAELALELAQNNAHAREEIEAWYQQCLGRNLELEASMEQQQRHLLQNGELLLQNGDHHHSTDYDNNQHIVPSSFSEDSRTVETASIPSPLDKKEGSPSRPSSSMVAIGRKLWEQSRAATGSRRDKKMPSLSSVAERSKERNRQLTQRRKTFLLQDDTSTSAPPLLALTAGGESYDEVNGRISKLLRASGRRLALPGRWWAKPEASSSATPTSTENLTKHYCQAVENLVEHKQKEVSELEALCTLMEEQK